MAKRRRNKRSLERSRDEDDDEDDEEQPSRRSRKQGGRKEPGKRSDMVMLGVMIVVIVMIIGGYFAYSLFLSPDDDNGGQTNPPRREIQLQVITDTSHNFGVSSTHDSDINGKTDFLLLVTNLGEATDTVEFKSSGGAADMTLSFDRSTVTVKKNGAMYAIVTIATAQAGFGSFSVTATSVDDAIAKDTVTLNVDAHDLNDRQAGVGDVATVYYVLVDRGTDDAYNPDKWAYNRGGEFPDFTIGEGVIEGFSDMAVGMKAGETHVTLMPESKAYMNEPGYPKGDLLYEMTMLEIQ